jgi:hypothetical protein
MFICAWSFDLQYGTREQALRLLKETGTAIKSTGWRAKRTRILGGSIGAPESRIIIEHEFNSLADLEASWDGLHQKAEFFAKTVTQMKSIVLSGSPRWEVYRVLDEG